MWLLIFISLVTFITYHRAIISTLPLMRVQHSKKCHVAVTLASKSKSTNPPPSSSAMAILTKMLTDLNWLGVSILSDRKQNLRDVNIYQRYLLSFSPLSISPFLLLIIIHNAKKSKQQQSKKREADIFFIKAGVFGLLLLPLLLLLHLI